jgi:hypothetical protein
LFRNNFTTSNTVPAHATTSDSPDDISLSSREDKTVQTLEQIATQVPTEQKMQGSYNEEQQQDISQHKTKKKQHRNRKQRKSKNSTKRRSHDSSSSSSSSSSHHFDSSSESDSESSTLACDDFGNAKDISYFDNSEAKANMSKRVASQLKKLTSAAKIHNLKEFNTTKGTIDQRKSFFQLWSNTLQELLTSQYRYQTLLRDYPQLNTSELTITGNTALGQFLRLFLRKSTRDTIEATIGRDNRHNGLIILKHLMATYGCTTIIDCSNARQKLESTLWNDRDTIDSFTHRFMLRLSNYNESIFANTRNTTRPYDKDEVTMLFLKLLVTTMPTSHALYREVQTTYTQCELNINRHGHLDTDTTEIQRDLQALELTLRAISNDIHQAKQCQHRQHANTAFQSKKFKNVKCWGCGHGHHLRTCPTTSEEERQRLW